MLVWSSLSEDRRSGGFHSWKKWLTFSFLLNKNSFLWTCFLSSIPLFFSRLNHFRERRWRSGSLQAALLLTRHRCCRLNKRETWRKPTFLLLLLLLDSAGTAGKMTPGALLKLLLLLVSPLQTARAQTGEDVSVRRPASLNPLHRLCARWRLISGGQSADRSGFLCCGSFLHLLPLGHRDRLTCMMDGLHGPIGGGRGAAADLSGQRKTVNHPVRVLCRFEHQMKFWSKNELFDL